MNYHDQIVTIINEWNTNMEMSSDDAASKIEKLFDSPIWRDVRKEIKTAINILGDSSDCLIAIEHLKIALSLLPDETLISELTIPENSLKVGDKLNIK